MEKFKNKDGCIRTFWIGGIRAIILEYKSRITSFKVHLFLILTVRDPDKKQSYFKNFKNSLVFIIDFLIKRLPNL